MDPDLISVLKTMRHRPKMFLAEESLLLLETYVEGFQMCERLREQKWAADYHAGWSEFVDWLRERHEESDAMSWDMIVRKIEPEASEEDLFHLFFRELGEYLDGLDGP